MFNWKGVGVWSDSLMQSIPATFPCVFESQRSANTPAKHTAAKKNNA